MQYLHTAIGENAVPRAARPFFQHLVDTYASEANKVLAVWREFRDEDLAFSPHPRSMTVGEVMKHQLLSERRFFSEFLAAAEPSAADALPVDHTIAGYSRRMMELSLPRLEFLASREEEWWIEQASFFDARRERIWIFWRRVLHTAHHRTQLSVYLRLMGRAVPPTYGPTADVSWQGADPTV